MTAAIVPGTELDMLHPGVMVILAFAVLTLVAHLLRRSGRSETDKPTVRPGV